MPNAWAISGTDRPDATIFRTSSLKEASYFLRVLFRAFSSHCVVKLSKLTVRIYWCISFIMVNLHMKVVFMEGMVGRPFVGYHNAIFVDPFFNDREQRSPVGIGNDLRFNLSGQSRAPNTIVLPLLLLPCAWEYFLSAWRFLFFPPT